jgi:hypothetical protein
LFLLALLCLAVGCGADPEIPRGDSLEDVNGFGWGVGRVPPGQMFSILFIPLRNLSDQPLRILDIRPLKLSGTPEHARVIDIELAPRTKDVVPPPLGIYVSHPPVWRRGKVGCVVQDVVEAKGYQLKPSTDPADRAVLLTSIEAVADGPFRLDGFRVTYVSGEETFVESVPLLIHGRVESGAPPMKPSRNEAVCLSSS